MMQDAIRELRVTCEKAGIGENLTLHDMAEEAIRLAIWQPANVHVAANLGDDGLLRPKKPKKATCTRPGSAARVAVYAARIEAGEELWDSRDKWKGMG